MNLLDFSNCRLCPRNCGCDRKNSTGFCGCSDKLRAARAALHHWEEPCISGTQGSGTVFFSGCTLQCCFCQNFSVSIEHYGKDITPRRLGDIFLSLQNQGAHNINLVTPTQYLPWILPALELVRDELKIPVVYNCGGYEKTETIRLLKDYVDIWLPDLKYFDSALSARYSRASDYFSAASEAILQMVRQTGKPVLDPSGLMKKGVIIRHMAINNTNIPQANEWIKAVAEATGCKYADSASVLKAEDGSLREDYGNGDGIHLNADGFNAVLNYLRTHAYQ